MLLSFLPLVGLSIKCHKLSRDFLTREENTEGVGEIKHEQQEPWCCLVVGLVEQEEEEDENWRG